GVTSIKSQQYGDLNKFYSMTIPVDIPTWMREISMVHVKTLIPLTKHLLNHIYNEGKRRGKMKKRGRERR
ncbi:hypothetical protein STEG23_021699, partial [Scotinomys teguina]